MVANNAFTVCAGSPTCGTDSPSGGLRNGGTIPETSYIVTSWKDVLRLLYFGLRAEFIDGADLANRNCGRPERLALANNWNALFQNCTSSNCPTGIQHAFRPADGTGAARTFVRLLGAPPIDLERHVSPFCNTLTQGSNGTNLVDAATTQTVVNPGVPMPAPLPGRINHINTNITVCGNSATGYRGSYFTDFQDGDVIRRACVFSGGLPKEDVCSTRGDLGLVLPIWDVPAVDPYPTTACTTGIFSCFPAPRTNCAPPNTFETCPNGHNANVAGLCPVGQCAAPVLAGSLDPRCVAARGTNAPGDLPAGTIYDGRVHNLTTWNASGSNFIKAPVLRAKGFPVLNVIVPMPIVNVGMVGAFYRMHSINSIASPTIQCRAAKAIDQISCLLRASPCSIGIAGTAAVQGNTIALNVNNASPADTCIQNSITGAGTAYPLSQRMYLNTLYGFESLVPGSTQYKMANCFANGTASALAPSFGLTPLGVSPFCEDFDETQLGCVNAGGVNVNACAGNPF